MNEEWVWSVEPEILPTTYGKVLAMTPWSHPYNIGVIGDDAVDAERQFRAALDGWRTLHRRRLGQDAIGMLAPEHTR